MKNTLFILASIAILILAVLQISHILNFPGYLLAAAAMALVIWQRVHSKTRHTAKK